MVHGEGLPFGLRQLVPDRSPRLEVHSVALEDQVIPVTAHALKKTNELAVSWTDRVDDTRLFVDNAGQRSEIGEAEGSVTPRLEASGRAAERGSGRRVCAAFRCRRAGLESWHTRVLRVVIRFGC